MSWDASHAQGMRTIPGDLVVTERGEHGPRQLHVPNDQVAVHLAQDMEHHVLRVDWLQLQRMPGLTQVVVPELRQVGRLELQSLPSLEVLGAPRLRGVGTLDLERLPPGMAARLREALDWGPELLG